MFLVMRCSKTCYIRKHADIPPSENVSFFTLCRHSGDSAAFPDGLIEQSNQIILSECHQHNNLVGQSKLFDIIVRHCFEINEDDVMTTHPTILLLMNNDLERRILHVPNATRTIHNEKANLIIYCLNCIRCMQNSTYKTDITLSNADSDFFNAAEGNKRQSQ